MLCKGRFEILPTGTVEARVQAGAIVVHEGARYQGDMHMRSEGSFDLGTEQPTTRRPEARGARRSALDVPSFGGA